MADSPGTEPVEPVKHRPYPSNNDLRQNASLYRVAYDESVNALKTQVDELNGMRQRLVSFLAFVGSATGFLAGSALTATQSSGRSISFYIVAGAATVLMLAVIADTVTILRPKSAVIVRAASAHTIIGGYIEIDLPTNEGHLLRNLALHNDNSVKKNRIVLNDLRSKYIRAIALGSVELVVLAGLIWFCA